MFSHLDPENPMRHKQVKLVGDVDEHLPLFLHGLGSHGLFDVGDAPGIRVHPSIPTPIPV